MAHADAPPAFLAGLPPDFVREVRFPLPYLHMEPVLPASGPPRARLAESLPYRARGYLCHPFARPLSKCFPAEP